MLILEILHVGFNDKLFLNQLYSLGTDSCWIMRVNVCNESFNSSTDNKPITRFFLCVHVLWINRNIEAPARRIRRTSIVGRKSFEINKTIYRGTSNCHSYSLRFKLGYIIDRNFSDST